jgi:glycine hydroxymethyltransferase
MDADQTEAHIRRLADLGRQQTEYERDVINMIASDNAYPREAAEHPPYGGQMIQEGLRGSRPFAGARLHDEIEEFAEMVACETFGADAANVQPHSCSQANQAAYQALLAPGDVALALQFRAGGHLTHGLKINFSGQNYRFSFYGTQPDGYIDYDQVRDIARARRPKLIVCGSSSYPRLFDANALREIADTTGARLMFDLSHEAGLIAGRAIENPVPLADVTTMSLDKTLRGPFGGIVLCRRDLAKAINRAVHPGTQSSFPIRKLTDAAHALLRTHTPAFLEYAERVVANAKALEEVFRMHGVPLLTGGTDKHYIVADVRAAFGRTGANAERCLEEVGVLTSRQTIPSDDSNQGTAAGGLRLGTAWVTSRGYMPDDLRRVAKIVVSALSDSVTQDDCRRRVSELVYADRVNDIWN